MLRSSFEKMASVLVAQLRGQVKFDYYDVTTLSSYSKKLLFLVGVNFE